MKAGNKSNVSVLKEPDTGAERRDLIVAFADDVKRLLPIARFLASAAVPPDERDAVRQLAVGDSVFHLKNMLAALCSETARTMILGTDGEKDALVERLAGGGPMVFKSHKRR